MDLKITKEHGPLTISQIKMTTKINFSLLNMYLDIKLVPLTIALVLNKKKFDILYI